jgi:peptidoglycan/LPS O-acetylase OafA/YrhL
VKAERRPDLDGVRGIAILMVLMVHSSFYAHNLPRFVEDVTFYGVLGIAAEAMFYLAFPALLILRHRPLAMLATLVGSYAVAGATHFALMRILPPVRNRNASPSVSGSANCRHLHWAAGSRSRSAIGSAVLGSRPGLRPWRRLC